MVFATAVRLLGSPAEAEDVAQTVFLRAFQRFDEIGPSPAAAGWLKTVTRNACLNHLSRYRARWRFFSELDRPNGDSSARATDELAIRRGGSPARGCRAGGPARPAGAGAPPASGSPARAARAVSFRGHELSGHRRVAGVSLGKVKTDIHRGREALRRAAGDRLCTPLISKRSSTASSGGFPLRERRRRCCRGCWPPSRHWSQRPWYSRAWFTWPIGGQIVSAAALILVVVGARVPDDERAGRRRSDRGTASRAASRLSRSGQRPCSTPRASSGTPSSSRSPSTRLLSSL